MMSSVCSIGTPAAGTSLADAEKTGLEIQKRLGVSSLEDMRYIPADKIIQLQNERQLGYHIDSGVRTGAIVDGYFTPGTKEEMAKTHQMSDVPIIGNFNSGESASPLQKATTVAEYREIAAKIYGADAPAFLKLYPVTRDSDIPAVAAKVAREAAIANASRTCGVNQTLYNKSPAYIDMFDHKYTFTPGVKIADVNTATIGVYHNADIPYWFGNLDIFNLFRKTRDLTPRDRTLSKDMQDSLVAFAKTGNPNTPAVKWPAWKPDNDVFVDFGDTIKVEKFNTKAMAWLAAHPQGAMPAGGGQGAPGTVVGAAPRD
jgi:para-nitrobenzyl esterase